MSKLQLTILTIFILLLANGADAQTDFTLKTSFGEVNVQKYKSYYYASFDWKGSTPVSLLSKGTVQKVEISPKSYHIPFSLKKNSINFRLEKSGFILVRLNDSVRIFIFADPPKTVPEKNQLVDITARYMIDKTGIKNETQKIQQALNEISNSGKTLLFPLGIYKTGQLTIQSNSKIYFERGAVLNADTVSIAPYYPNDSLKTKRFISLTGVKNVLISGFGEINGNGLSLRKRYGDEARMRLIMVANSKNICIDGLILKDPGSWNTQVLLSENVTLRNLKILNDIGLSNTDGIDPDAVNNLLIDNCFAYCSDDNVAVKSTGNSGLLGNVENITVKNCVFLTKKSALKVGTETRAETMKNIFFENNDILECDRGMALYVSDGATLDSIFFKNNRFERNYPDAQRKAIHFDVSKRNPNSKLGEIKYVLISDCCFESAFPRKSVIKSAGEINGIKVIIENLKIGGQKVTDLKSAGIDASNAIIQFK